MKVQKPIYPARWREEFLSHISKVSSPEFVLSTLHDTEAGGHTSKEPRARFCIYRGLWCELPAHPKNHAQLNNSLYQSDLLTFTTDVRMCKIPQIFTSGEENQNVVMSGGGGPVEAVFWIKEASTQWRFRGEAYVVGNDIDDDLSSAAKYVKKVVGERMRPVKEDSKDQWSWSRELTAHFGNLSPWMRGSFKNPPPGTPVSVAFQDPNLSLGNRVDDLHDEIARKNFRVVIIMPDQVEKLYLTDIPEKQRRWLYTYTWSENQDQPDGWNEVECWP